MQKTAQVHARDSVSWQEAGRRVLPGGDSQTEVQIYSLSFHLSSSGGGGEIAIHRSHTVPPPDRFVYAVSTGARLSMLTDSGPVLTGGMIAPLIAPPAVATTQPSFIDRPATATVMGKNMRPVSRKRTRMDASGRMISETVVEYEEIPQVQAPSAASVSNAPKQPPAKKGKSSAASATAGVNGKNLKQRSISSFFKK